MGMAQVVTHTPSMWKTLGSVPVLQLINRLENKLCSNHGATKVSRACRQGAQWGWTVFYSKVASAQAGPGLCR
jgi:hypothetical protein